MVLIIVEESLILCVILRWTADTHLSFRVVKLTANRTWLGVLDLTQLLNLVINLIDIAAWIDDPMIILQVWIPGYDLFTSEVLLFVVVLLGTRFTLLGLQVEVLLRRRAITAEALTFLDKGCLCRAFVDCVWIHQSILPFDLLHPDCICFDVVFRTFGVDDYGSGLTSVGLWVKVRKL